MCRGFGCKKEQEKQLNHDTRAKVRIMKERHLVFIRFNLCLLFILLQTSCGLKQEHSALVNGKENVNPFNRYRVSCIIPHKDDGSYWLGIVNGLQKAGEDYKIDVKMSYPSLNYNSGQMIDLIRMAISARVNAIVVPGSESPGYKEILQKALDNGITVILIDTDMEDFVPSLYVGSDNFNAGKLIGEKLALSSNGKATIGIISGDVEFYNLEQRLSGFIYIISTYPQMQIKAIEYDRFDYLQIQNSYRRFIQDAEIDTIICLEGTGAIAITPLIEPSHPIRIIAFDDSNEGLSAIEAGIFEGLVVQEKYEMGYEAIKELDKLRRNGKFISDKIITDLRYLSAHSKN